VALVAGLLVLQFVVFGLVARLAAGISAFSFFARAWTPILTAFSTGSSAATLPTTLRAAEDQFGIDVSIAGFVIPLGATMSRAGTALFQSVTLVFLAQAFGIQLGLSQYVLAAVASTLTALAVAGILSGAIPLLASILPVVGVPREAIAIVLGVDQLTSMARTVPNVTGALLASVVIARAEGRAAQPAKMNDGRKSQDERET